MHLQAYGDQSLGHSIVFQWHRAFQIGQVLLIGDIQNKHPTTTYRIEEDILKDSALYTQTVLRYSDGNATLMQIHMEACMSLQ